MAYLSCFVSNIYEGNLAAMYVTLVIASIDLVG